MDLDQILEPLFQMQQVTDCGISIIASFTTYDQAGGNEREIDSGNTIKLLSELLFKKQSILKKN